MTTELQNRQQPSAFLTTRWTRVCRASADSEDGRRALEELCGAYYMPVVAWLRGSLRDAEAARDMSHAFFAEILAGGTIATADPGRGRFRSYLLGALKHFLSRQRESAGRLKRGGGAELVPLDAAGCLEAELADARQPPPDAEYDRQWAVTVLTRGLEALRSDLRAEGREGFFEVVKPLLTGDAAHGDQAAMAAACGMNLDAFRMAARRLKLRLRQSVKAEVAGTLDDPGSVQAEMESLFAALGR